jgi:hypothetical protein
MTARGLPRAAFAAGLLAAALALSMPASAGDSRGPMQPHHAPSTNTTAPPPGEATTSTDNENNALTGHPDGDMGFYLFNTYGLDPVEFNIFIPEAANARPIDFSISAFDVDSADGEVDMVYINGVRAGTLRGKPNEDSVTVFKLPERVMHVGKNLVQIYVDTANPGQGVWGVTINSGTIRFLGSVQPTVIRRAWAVPVLIKQGEAANFFAEVTGPADYVEVYRGASVMARLTDPDGDGLFSGQFTTRLRSKTGTILLHMAAFNDDGSGVATRQAEWPAPLTPRPPTP